MAEIRREENFSSSGLSTAALAHADEPAQQEEYSDERSAQRVDGYDRGDATVTRNTNNSGQAVETDERTALFSPDETNSLKGQWDSIQVGFVDEPRQAVEKADALVAGAMKRLAEVFAAERERLEKQWDRGDSVDRGTAVGSAALSCILRTAAIRLVCARNSRQIGRPGAISRPFSYFEAIPFLLGHR
jgi:hypothetical protein